MKENYHKQENSKSLNFTDDYSQFNKRNSGFIQVNTSIFYLHESKVIDDKELIFLCRVLGDCNGKNSNTIKISHSRVMRFASCGNEKANKILKRMTNELHILSVVGLNKRQGYFYRLNLDVLERLISLNFNIYDNRRSETSTSEAYYYDNRSTALRSAKRVDFDNRIQLYINELIKDYYSYIRFLTPHSKIFMASEFYRLEKHGFNRQAIKFFIKFNKVDLEKTKSIFALIKSYGKEYFSSLEIIKDSFNIKESKKEEKKQKLSIEIEQPKPPTEEELKEIEEAKKYLANFIKT